MGRMHAETRLSSEISTQDFEVMYSIFDEYYRGIDKEGFKSDLQEKDYLLLLLDEEEKIHGFTGVEVLDLEHENEQVRVLYSGDTIIEKEFWGEQTLPYEWCKLSGRIKSEQPETPLYWFLIAGGDRTYRFLHVFSDEYYPSPDGRSDELKRLLEHVAKDKFGEKFDKTEGVIHMTGDHAYHLKKKYAQLDERVDRNKYSQFFLENNPGYRDGDELCCIVELTEDNMKSIALRGFKQGLRRGSMATH